MRLIIRVERNDSMIDEVFNDMEREGKFRSMQLKVFKAVYKSKLKGLYHLIRKRVASYIRLEGNNFFEAVDEGDSFYINERKKAFEKFMYGGEEELRTEKEYQKFSNDRIIIKVMRYFGKKKTGITSRFFKMALGKGQVISFFNRYGITVSWKVRE